MFVKCGQNAGEASYHDVSMMTTINSFLNRTGDVTNSNNFIFIITYVPFHDVTCLCLKSISNSNINLYFLWVPETKCLRGTAAKCKDNSHENSVLPAIRTEKIR